MRWREYRGIWHPINLVYQLRLSRDMGEKAFTYCLAANVWMPDFRIELHYWRAKRVVVRYLDVDCVCASLVRCARWSLEGAL